MPIFNLDEMNIMEMYSGQTKEILIQNMKFALPYMESNFQKITKGIIEKLSLLSEEDYQNMVLFTSFE